MKKYQPTHKEIAHSMRRFGGSFVSSLGEALLKADPDNAKRIKKAFPDYWKRYTKFAKRDFATYKD